MNNMPSLVRLIKQLQQIPYLASKNIYRVANHLLAISPEKAEQLCAAILQAKENIVQCTICFTWKEKRDECPFCSSKKREQDVICVIETWQELLSVEKTQGYNGLYHVLGGAISPLDGIGPEDLTINKLLERINNTSKEIILATNQTPEGEATAAYIASKLKKFENVKISCLARGVPVGSSLEFMDRLTVYKALSERRPF